MHFDEKRHYSVRLGQWARRAHAIARKASSPEIDSAAEKLANEMERAASVLYLEAMAELRGEERLDLDGLPF